MRSVRLRIAGEHEGAGGGLSAEARPERPLPAGSTWRLFAAWPNYGWLSKTTVTVVAEGPAPTWIIPPRVRTALPVPYEIRDGVTTLLVPGDDDLRVGLRPIDTGGRRGPAVELSLGEARAEEAAEHAAEEARCRAVAMAAADRWEEAAKDAAVQLRAVYPACVDAADADDVPSELRWCSGRPEFERVRELSRITTRMRRADTTSAVWKALTDGDAVATSWHLPHASGIEVCTAVLTGGP